MIPPPSHPLDTPVWQALTGRQAALARGGAAAVRIDPDYGLFAAMVDHSAASAEALAALIAAGDTIGLFEATTAPLLPGFRIVRTATCLQMLATIPDVPEPGRQVSRLNDADASDMLALADLTRPGPFFRSTHRFGDFVGIRSGGRLVAMAGTRLALKGYREVSGVCTHPDHRGQGLAAEVIVAVMHRIRAGGDVPFLTSYTDNPGAIALYERLGFVARRELILTLLERG